MPRWITAMNKRPVLLAYAAATASLGACAEMVSFSIRGGHEVYTGDRDSSPTLEAATFACRLTLSALNGAVSAPLVVPLALPHAAHSVASHRLPKECMLC